MSGFYIDANGTDGANLAQVERVYPDGTRVPLSAPELSDTPAHRAAAIPNWAAWTEAEAVAYIESNVTSLANAKVVLIALARVVVALRDATWPHLGA
jgi:hypothetical protein